jgi:serine/threonine protein kinase
MGERQFGPYRLVHQIAVGGMAEIYLAKTRGIAGFEKYVALKMIHPNFSQDEQFIEMLIDEAKISVQLQHANIAQTFDLGRVEQFYYITMEYVDGADLYKLLRRAAERGMSMPVDVAAFIAKEMANGLDYAHRRRDLAGQALGIVHRDVSPQNVLISHAGEVKLVDFGIAKATMKARQTAVGVIKGKYYYMSPEQAWGDRVDHRTDIFSTGVCLYEALTGRMMHQEEDLQKLLQLVRRAEIPSPTTRRRDVPPQLERIVMRALAKEREERYQSAGDMATDLERFLHVYSPVFTAAKVAELFRAVILDDAPGAPAPQPAPKPQPPAKPQPAARPQPAAKPQPPAKRRPSNAPVHTMRLEPDQILSDSSELSDENSLIFDLGRPSLSGITQAPGFSTSAHTLAGVSPGAGRGVEDLDNIDEQTMVSGPPGFGAPAGFSGIGRVSGGGGGGFGGGGGDYEPTLVGTGFEDNAHYDEGATEAASDIHGEPTLLQADNSDLQRRLREANNMSGAAAQPPRPQPPARPGGPAKRPPSHPALAASTPKPAVSLTGPRRGRKTPTDGVPAEGNSLLAALVKQDGAEQPVRRDGAGDAPPGPGAGAGPGAGMDAPTLPARPGAAAQAQAAPGNPSGGMPLPAPPMQGAPQGAPMHGAMPGSAPWPGAYPGVAGNASFSPPGFGQQPFSGLPAGQVPSSFTKQLQQLDLEHIPDAYKVGRKTPRWLVPAVLVVACVGAGVGLGIMFLGGGKEKKEATLIIESMPAGAQVTVNGIRLPEPTPTPYQVEPSKRYEIVFEKPGFQSKTHEVLVPAEPRDYRVPVTLQRVHKSVAVTSAPPNAEIYLNGVLQGRTPRSLANLDPGVDYTLELRLKGYQRHTQKIVWPEDKTEITIDITLAK